MIITQVLTRPSVDVDFFGMSNPSYQEFVEALRAIGMTTVTTLSEDELTVTQELTVPDENKVAFSGVQAKYQDVSAAEHARRNAVGVTTRIYLD